MTKSKHRRSEIERSIRSSMAPGSTGDTFEAPSGAVTWPQRLMAIAAILAFLSVPALALVLVLLV